MWKNSVKGCVTIGIEQLILGTPAIRQARDILNSTRRTGLISGLQPVCRVQFIQAAGSLQKSPVLILTKDEPTAVRLVEYLCAFAGDRSAAVLYPYREPIYHEMKEISHEYEYLRLSVLHALQQPKKPAFVVASAAAALSGTIPPDILRRNTEVLNLSTACSREELIRMLLEAGYTCAEQIEGVGQFAFRGGIVDFFPPGSPDPYRVELWGDTIDSISSFHVDTQRRDAAHSETRITPARELLVTRGKLLEMLERHDREQVKGKGKSCEQLARDIQALREEREVVCLDRYYPLIYPRAYTLLDYLPKAPLLLCDLAAVRESMEAASWRWGEDILSLMEQGILAPGIHPGVGDYDQLLGEISRRPALVLDSFQRSYEELKPYVAIHVTVNELPVWTSSLKELAGHLRVYLNQGYGCIVFAGSEKGADNLAFDLTREGLMARAVEAPAEVRGGELLVSSLLLPAGFEYPEEKLMGLCYGRVSMPGAQRRRRRRKAVLGESSKIKDLADLAVGDKVVHISHGIGIFQGITKKEVQGVTKDYIQIQYGGTDVLFVPVTQMDLVTKYIGSETVRLSRLHSGEWQKVRSRVKRAVSELASDLISLYAQRLKVKGYAFAEDNDWQREFEQRFIYEETEDQLKCIDEIKSDMQRSVPMDRLLCGDVGFGKTEVALRAAFKCVLEGKQCAFMVPSTILAWQHYQTIKERMEPYPVAVELLSRFRTPTEQRDVVRRLQEGKVDIVVGTHRIIQKDVTFHDLGLCIIDEEQMFGVRDKEKLKTLRNSVDVLTLSATPIPRTLNMAMSGIRDISLINDPPGERHPVQTYVLEENMSIAVEAINRELRRGGQVFYLHNRVHSIDSCAGRLRELLPDARIAVAHGQMGEQTLSETWRALVDREIDILVCTTIIETGVDVPNCNTLIIEDADRLGLAQLYQLRGRVGRSERHAYAYLMFRPGKALTEVSEKRLAAIKEFTAFGSGFRIAMRDLEIRGAGDVLGSQQHGHMEAVGYDLYLKLLSNAIIEQKGESIPVATECTVDLQIGAHIPEEYIPSQGQRIDIYKKLADIKTEEDASDMLDELIDRFGDPPKAVQGLVEISLIRGRAAALGIREINQREESILLIPQHFSLESAAGLASTLQGRVLVSAGTEPYITVRLQSKQKPLEGIQEVLSIMEQTLHTP